MKRLVALILAVGLLLGYRSLAGAEGRTIVKFGRDIVVEQGTRVREAVSIGGNITVDGVVDHNVVAVAGSVTLGPRAVVGRNVVSVGGVIEKAEGAEVRGDLVEVDIPGISSVLSPISKGWWEGLCWALGIIAFIAFVGFLALSLLIVALLPGPVGLISAAVEEHTLKVSLWGLLGVMLIVPLAVFLAISVIGIMLIPIEMILVVCALLVGYIAVARLVGKKITEALRRPGQPMLLETFSGLIILWLIGWIPVLGWVVKAVAALLGMGGVIAALLGRRTS